MLIQFIIMVADPCHGRNDLGLRNLNSKHDQDADIETTSGTLASETAYPYLNLI